MIPEYYEFICPVKVLSGKKALANLPFEMENLGVKRALIVSDPGVAGAGLIKKVVEAFGESDCEAGVIFDKTPPDSGSTVVNEVAKLFLDNKCDCFIAVGGGSSIDTAKCANMVIVTGTPDLMQFQGVDRLTQSLKPFIVIPTTAGTGSEVTSAAVIYDEATHTKLAFTSNHLFPDVAILDPKMTESLPPKITAATGMDALTHAMEAYYCLAKNPVSDAYAIAAIRLIFKYLLTSTKKGNDLEARLAMLNASMLAGIAFSNSLVGVVHGIAHATGGVARVPHGVANSIYLPFGLENNFKKAGHIIAELVPFVGETSTGDVKKDAEVVVAAVRKLAQQLKEASGLPTTLKEAGVTKDQLEDIAKACINDGSCTINPEDITYEVALDIAKKAFE
ncbi:MAG: iron-containing alcohol dehydrogenase [Deltaproteobacteria bacterium]|nr:iron-containing alcohol dehydrogenase [Candidatus Zymogenaceae bacterium]